MGLGVIWATLLVIGIIMWFGYDLPDIDDIVHLPRRPSITLFDQNNNTLAIYGDFYGRPITVKELPPHLIKALLATEDRRFFSHFGIDPIGFVRAFMRNIQARGIVQGGSTLTQQLCKNFLQAKKLYGPYDRSLRRKISEFLLSLFVERKFTKDQILSMYLNRMYMGAGTYGIDAAALRYFGKHASELGLYESATLVGLLRAPSRYSPVSNPERSEGRAKQVLQSMVESRFISQDALNAAMAMPAPLDEGVQKSAVHYFADWIFEILPETVDMTGEDLEVITTISLPFQKIAERQAQKIMQTRGKLWKAQQAALVCMKPDGAVQALIGGMDYRHSKFNRVTQALRQPGSAFKYFVYLAALEEGYGPNSLIDDTPFYHGHWAPKNYKYKALGETTLREAFTWSVNSVAARLAEDIGVKRIIAMSRRLGITTQMPNNLTISLGTGEVTLLEMTGAFSITANQGIKVKPYGILQVRNKQGTVLYQHKPEKKKVLPKRSIKHIMHLMNQVVSRGTGRFADIPGKFCAGKTGTSQDYKDVWLVAMVPEFVTGIWFGCDDGKPLTCCKGGSPTSHLWKAFTSQALKYLKNPEAFDPDMEEIINPSSDLKTKKKEKYEEERDDEEDEDEDDDDEEDDEEDDEPLVLAKKITAEKDENKKNEGIDNTIIKKPPSYGAAHQENQKLLRDIINNLSNDEEDEEEDDDDDDEEETDEKSGE